MSVARSLRDAHRLYLTESRTDTIIAIVLVLAVLTPLVIRLYRSQAFDRMIQSRR